ARQKWSGLQSRLRGPYFRRFLAHSTTMGRGIVENLSSRSRLFASNLSTAHAPSAPHPAAIVDHTISLATPVIPDGAKRRAGIHFQRGNAECRATACNPFADALQIEDREGSRVPLRSTSDSCSSS